jgi:D-amino-acid oxidase
MRTRRYVVGLSAAGLLSACATPLGAVGPRIVLPRVKVSQERLVRVDVGLRPYRPSGFRVARETRGEKTIVHNYGHGGCGVTLSWGTSALALDLGFDPAESAYAVLGAGVVGLSTARLLQERGAKVRIYAKALSPNTTSNVAGAQWWPASLFDPDRRTEAFLAQYHAALPIAHRRFQSLIGPDYGVAWEPNYVLSERPFTDYPAPEGSVLRTLAINQRDLYRGENPFDAPYVRVWDTMMIETPHYLHRLERDVREAGGEIVVREFKDSAELAALPERTIFNCTGLGAGVLFGDAEIEPVRGQLAILLPQEEIGYNVLSPCGYMFGRRDGIVLGGTFQHGNWSLEADDADTSRILAGNAAIFDAMALR